VTVPEHAYGAMLAQFGCTLKEASADNHDSAHVEYMTHSSLPVVSFDRVKDDYIKGLHAMKNPKSCDALYLSPQKDFFLIEFKNGVIGFPKNNDVKLKVYDSLLILLDKLGKTIGFSRTGIELILVYNENVTHPPNQFDDAVTAYSRSLDKIRKKVSRLAKSRLVHFGLYRYQNLYFREVYTYNKAEFQAEFVAKYDTGS